jgi:hypothetical protein
LSLQKEKLEFLVRQFQNNDESLQKIKEFIRQTVEQRLANKRHVLLLALQSIMDSCRRDPIKFNILYHNLSADAITREIRLAEFGMIDQYNYALSTNEQLCYQHENANDDVAYCKILVEAAEQFFNMMIKELEHVCINQIVDAFNLSSIFSHLAKNSLLDSKAALPLQTYENEKEGGSATVADI